MDLLDRYEDEWNRSLTDFLKERLRSADRKQREQLLRDIAEMQSLHHITKRQARELLELAEKLIQPIQPVQPAAEVAATTSANRDTNRTYKQLLLF